MPRGATRETEAAQRVTMDTRVVEQPGLEFPRFFSREDVDPFDEFVWESRTALIGSEQGEVVLGQVAKVHFRNAARALGQPEPPR